MNILNPPAVIGIIGGGQLGQMLALSAIAQGYWIAVLDPDANCPCSNLAHHFIQAAYNDEDALKRLNVLADVITYEFENVDVEATKACIDADKLPQGFKALMISQDRLLEKQFAINSGIPCVPFEHFNTKAEYDDLMLNHPRVIKTRRYGYDGKGQTWLYTQTDKNNCQLHFPHPYVIEDICLFDKEISVAVCSFSDGIVAYEPFENVHVSGILRSSIYPARIEASLAEKAVHYATQLVEALDYRGILVVEFFVMGDAIYFNEFAPRPHNSAHGTIETCDFSQFDLHIRAITNHPKRNPKRLQCNLMLNILGENYEQALKLWSTSLEPIHLHLYGKTEIRPQRKMGHLSFNADTMDPCIELLNQWRTR
jgi:5-(carboxyamino)imidazole ribonucleotide synthase